MKGVNTAKQLGVGIIGAGIMGSGYAKACKAYPNLKVGAKAIISRIVWESERESWYGERVKLKERNRALWIHLMLLIRLSIIKAASLTISFIPSSKIKNPT